MKSYPNLTQPEILEKLKIARRAMHLSAERIALSIGVKTRMLYIWESGSNTHLNLAHLHKWCQALGFRLDVTLTDEE